jgi:type II secretory pathway component GspD/PulD (secretin)
MMKRFFMLLITGLLLTSGVEANELEVINLKHRSAEELLPIIRPLLDQDEMVSGMNYQLILRASTRNIAQIRRLLDSIDTQPRSLRITVMQDVDSETVARLTEVSGSIGLGRNARVAIPGNNGAAMGRDTVNARIISTRSLEDDRKTLQLQVLEGNRARVSTGQTMQVPQRQVVQTAWGTQVISTMHTQDIASGFYVLPRINGDTVTLEISTQNDSIAPNQNQANYPVTRIQNTSSRVTGRLGEWIAIGGLSQQSHEDNSSITTRSSSRLDEQRNVLIKVEEVN